MQIQPYLFFAGRAEEAANFYCDAVGAKLLMLMRFRDSREPRHRRPVRAPRRTRSCT